MRSATLPNPSALAKSAVALALAGACLFVTDASARDGRGSGGVRPVAASPAGGQWHGRHVRGDGHRWHGGHRHHGHRWHGHRHHWHFHPGWAWGVGAGVALTYPWWGWGYPYGYYGHPYSYPYYGPGHRYTPRRPHADPTPDRTGSPWRDLDQLRRRSLVEPPLEGKPGPQLRARRSLIEATAPRPQPSIEMPARQPRSTPAPRRDSSALSGMVRRVRKSDSTDETTP